MRTHKPVSVSLPEDLFNAAESRAAELGFKRATYIQQLILADLKRAAEEQPPGAGSPTPPAAAAPAPAATPAPAKAPAKGPGRPARATPRPTSAKRGAKQG